MPARGTRGLNQEKRRDLRRRYEHLVPMGKTVQLGGKDYVVYGLSTDKTYATGKVWVKLIRTDVGPRSTPESKFSRYLTLERVLNLLQDR